MNQNLTLSTKLFASQNHLQLRIGERTGGTSQMVFVYHKCMMIHIVSMSFPQYPKSKIHHTVACDNHKIDMTHCITPSQVGNYKGRLIRGITT